MKVECLKEKLLSATSSAEKVTSKNLSLPILSCVLLSAQNNTLTIRATNLDIGVEFSFPAKVEEEGEVAIPGVIFTSYLSNLYDDKNVVLETKDQTISISTKNSSSTIKTFPPDDFPTIPLVDKTNSFLIHSSEFVKGLKAVWYSSSVSSIKPELSSVYVYTDGSYMVFVATDSFRLAEQRVKLKKAKEYLQVLIPFKNIPDIIRILEPLNDEIEVSLEKNQASFTYKGLYLTSRVIDGVFPDYKQIIPKEFKTEATVLKQDFLQPLKLSRVFSDSFHQIHFKVDPKEKLFEMTSRNNDVGESSNKLQAVLEGEPIDVNFNYKYILDCFQSIDADSLSLQFSGLNRPMIIRPIGSDTFMYLVMPMNK